MCNEIPAIINIYYILDDTITMYTMNKELPAF